MSAVKSGSFLRSLALTPERVPQFFIPSAHSPLLLLSPRLQRSTDHVRLLSDPEESQSPGASPGGGPGASQGTCPATNLGAGPRRLRLPRIHRPRREADTADTDMSTRAAMSLKVEKVTTPYGFKAVLAASPCTRRRESQFHRTRAVPVLQVTPDPGAAVDPDSGTERSRFSLRPLRSLGSQMMKELKRSRRTTGPSDE